MNENLNYLKRVISAALVMILLGTCSYAQLQLSANTVKYQLTYNPASGTYTVSVVPDYATPNTFNLGTDEIGGTAQVTIKAPAGFDVVGAVTSLKGDWAYQGKLDGATYGAAYAGFSYLVFGKTPEETNYGPFAAGTPVGLFTFSGNSCLGKVGILAKADPFVAAAAAAPFSLNVECSFYSRSGQSGNDTNPTTGGNQEPLEQFIDKLGPDTECRSDLMLAKTVNNPTPNVGNNVVFTITVTNSGPGVATGVVVSDQLPSGYTFVSDDGATPSTYDEGTGLWTIGTIAAGTSATLAITAKVNPTGVYLNYAQVSASNDLDIDSTPGNGPQTPDEDDDDQVNTVPVPVADLAISKTDGSATYTPGEPITYTIVVGNAGPSDVTGATVADAIPAAITGVSWTSTTQGTATVSSGGSGSSNSLAATVNIPAGAGNTVTFTVTGTVSASATGDLVNTATVTAPAGVTDNDLTNNSATDTDTQNSVADLSISKTDGKATYTPGEPIQYTIVVSSAGPSDVTGATVADAIPATITGASWTSTTQGTATVGSGSTGSGNALAATVNLPAGSGNTVTFTVTGTVSASATGDLVNTATVTAPSSVTDNDLTNNSATDTDTQNSVADLSISKTDGKATYTPGEPIQYTIVVSSAGPSDVTGATVADAIPATITGASWTSTTQGTATVGSGSTGSGNALSATVNLPAGSGNTVTFTVTGTVSASTTGDLVNTATVTAPSGVTDNDLTNNSATDTDTQNSVADLSISKTDGTTKYTPGSPISYTIIVSNDGPSDVTGATVADAIPATITGASWTSTTQGTATVGSGPTGSGNALSATVNLPAGSGNTVTFTVTGTVSASATGDLVNVATVTAPTGVTDPIPGNNSAMDTDTQNSVADLAISKTDGSPTYTPGSPITYTIVVSNVGPSNVTGATVADAIPATITGVSWTSTVQGAATVSSGGSGSGNSLSATVNLPAGAGNTVTFTVTGTVLPATTGDLSNTATVTAPTGVTDNDLTNNSVTDTDTQNSVADLSISKADGSTTYTPGEPITYTIIVSNTGPSNVTGATVADAIPATITNVSWSSTITGTASVSSGGSGSGNSLSATVNLPAGAGNTVTFTVTGTVSASATGDLSNTATVTAPTGVTDNDLTNNSATDTDTQKTVADLAIVKTLSVQRPEPGANVTFTLGVTNNGPSAETGVAVADLLPAGFTYVSDNGSGAYTGGTWTIGSMAAGGTASLEIVATINATGSYVNTAIVSGDNTANDPNTGNNTSTASLEAQVLRPKVYLQGALFGVTYSAGTTVDSLMRDDLRAKSLIPLTSPYGYWNPTVTDSTIASSVLNATGRDAIVDWVFVELRDVADSTKIVSSRSALLQRDGDIVGLDGVLPIPVRSPAGSAYYVAVRHRNHLGVMTAGAVTMTVAGTTVDFRKASTPTYRKANLPIHQSQVDVLQGKALWAGNALRDNGVVYQGTDNDVNIVSQQVLGATGNTDQRPYYILKGYHSGDINMNGEVIFQGSGNDVEYIYQNVIKNHPGNGPKDNIFVIQQQLPE